MISGNAVIFQMGAESSYGVSASASHQIRISSESFKPTYNKVSEGLATGSKGSGKVQTMGIKAGGSFSTLMRPDMDLILKMLCGVQTLGDDGEKVFTTIGNGVDDHLPSFTAYIDRKVDVFAYPGCKINSVAFSASAGGYLGIDVDVVCKDEEDGGALTPELTPSALQAFTFAGGKYKLNDAVLADVKSINWTHNNNLDADTQTSDTGYYFKEAECGTREITGGAELIYAPGAEDVRKNYYKTDDTFSFELEFTSGDKKLVVEMPACQLTDSGANMSSPTESLSMSVSFNVVDEGSELITYKLI